MITEKRWNIIPGPSLLWPYEGAVFGCLQDEEKLDVSLIELYCTENNSWCVREKREHIEQCEEVIVLDVVTVFPNRDEAATFASERALNLLSS